MTTGHTVSGPGIGRRSILAELLDDRRQVRVLAAVLVLNLGLGAVGSSGFGPIGWTCPLLWALGLPCPGCGLTRGTLALLGGHPSAALAAHPLAPLALVVGFLLVAAALLPRPAAARLAAAVRRVEGAAPVDLVAAIALIVVWLIRLVSPSFSGASPLF